MKALWLSIGVGVVVLMACGLAGGGSNDGTGATLVLRTYNIPSGYPAQEVQSLLRDALWMPSGSKGEGTSVARATLSPDGRVLVLGTPGVQEGVATLIAQMKEGTPQGPARSVMLHYWIVSGRPSPTVELTPELASLEEPLKTIATKDGPQHFELRDHLSLIAVAGERSTVKSARTEIVQMPSLVGNHLSAWLEFELKNPGTGMRFGDLRTRVSMDAGKTLVLGQIGDAPDGKPQGNLYYLVRAQLADAPVQ